MSLRQPNSGNHKESNSNRTLGGSAFTVLKAAHSAFPNKMTNVGNLHPRLELPPFKFGAY
jgi:hypothetical protein